MSAVFKNHFYLGRHKWGESPTAISLISRTEFLARIAVFGTRAFGLSLKTLHACEVAQ